jgi:hypothetical protein
VICISEISLPQFVNYVRNMSLNVLVVTSTLVQLLLPSSNVGVHSLPSGVLETEQGEHPVLKLQNRNLFLPSHASGQHRVMENILSGTQYEHLDPHTPLSNEDIIRLLMEYCNKKVDDHNKKIEEHFRKENIHTSDMIKLVVNGLGSKIGNVTDTLAKHSATLEEKLADVELKQETVGKYQEHLLYSLKLSLQDTFHLIEEDMKSLNAETLTCSFWTNNFQSLRTPNAHL